MSIEEKARFVADLIPDKDIGYLIYQAYLQGARDQRMIDEEYACDALRRFMVFVKGRKCKNDIEEVVNYFRNTISKEE